MKCGIIPPRRHEIIGNRSDCYLPECERESSHAGARRFVTPEGVVYEWETDMGCECCGFHEDDYDDWCIVYEKIQTREVQSEVRS